MGLRQRCQKVYQATQKLGIKSVRALARVTKLSKSSVHRISQRIKHRQQHPESYFWETPEGDQWLRLLVFATIYIFGIKQGIGSEVLSEFFHLLRLNRQIGVSPTALRRLEAQMRSMILTYQQEQNQQIASSQTPVEIIAGADETFFPGVVLVLMDLVSGYLVLEEKTPNRQYSTWLTQAQAGLGAMGSRVHVKSVVSDRGKALVQLAVQGLGCPSLPDLFHGMRCLSRSMGSRLGGQLARLHKQLRQTTEQVRRRLVEEKSVPSRLRQRLSRLQEEYNFVHSGVETYRRLLHQISLSVHPFAIDGSGFQTSGSVAAALYQQLPQLAALGTTYQLDKIEKALVQFSHQVLGIAAGINLWWQSLEQSLSLEGVETPLENWLLTYLLPEVYWQQQWVKTKNPALREVYAQAYEQACSQRLTHPLTLTLTSEEVEQWRDWARRMVNRFQRSSSAVEGRNGYLSRLYHSGRGISSRDLRVLTVIHNFDLRRADGSTAAQRLFGRTFPQLFPWLIEKMGDLPLPRKPRKLVNLTPAI